MKKTEDIHLQHYDWLYYLTLDEIYLQEKRLLQKQERLQKPKRKWLNIKKNS